MRVPGLRQLRAYRAVMSLGSITAAAKVLNLSQPALSKQIAILENNLNLTLFDRHRGGPMIPTKEGLAFYQSIEGTLFGLDAIPQIAQEIHSRVRIRMSVAATPPIINSRPFMEALSKFRADHSDVQLALQSRPRVGLEDWVASRQADIALGLLPAMHPELTGHCFADTAVVAVVPTPHPLARLPTLTIDDLEGEDLILPGRQPLRDRIDAQLPNLDCAIESSSALTACNLAAARLGIAVSDPFSPTQLGPDVIKVIPLVPRINIRYGAMTAKGVPSSQQMATLVNHLHICCNSLTY